MHLYTATYMQNLKKACFETLRMQGVAAVTCRIASIKLHLVSLGLISGVNRHKLKRNYTIKMTPLKLKACG